MSGTTLAQAYVQILPTTKGIKGKLESELGSAGIASGGKAGFGGKFASAFTKFFAAAGVGEAIKQSIQEGAKLEQSIGGVETIFGEKDAALVETNAKKAYKALQISANDYMEQATSFSASLLQSLDGDTTKAAKAADVAITDMSDNANKMGTDIGDIQNAYQGFAKQNYTMLDNLKLGYGGTKTEMERLLTDAGKLSGKKYDISNLADVYEAIHVVQQEMGLTGTSAKEAETTLSGSFNAMKAAATNFMGYLTLGQNVGPAMKGLVETACTFLFKNLIPALGRIIQALPGAVGVLLVSGIPQILKGMTKVINGITAALDGQGSNQIYKSVTKVLKGVASALIKNLPALLAALARLYIQVAKTMITVLLPLLVRMLGTVKSRISSTITGLGSAMMTYLANGIRGAIGKVTSTVTGLVSKIKSLFNFNGLAGTVRASFNAVKNAITSPITTARNSLAKIVGRIKGIFPIRLGRIMNLKIPEIKVNGGKAPWGLGGKGVKPSFAVHWNAQGGIVDSPTILQGAGEAGPEGIIPLTQFWNKMDNIASAIQTSNGSSGGTLTVVMNLDGSTIAKSTIDYVNNQTIVFGTNPLTV